MTQLLAAVSAPSLGTTEVRHVELLRLQPNVVMAVVITATGGVAKRLFVFDGPVDSGLVDWATTYLAETVTGLRLGARQLASRLVDSSLGKSEREFLETLAPVFTELTDDGPGGLILGGTASLLAELRRRDVETIRDVVAALEERIDLLAAPARRARRRALDGARRRRPVRAGVAAARARDGELRPCEPPLWEPSPCSARRAWTTRSRCAPCAPRRWRSPISSRSSTADREGTTMGRARGGGASGPSSLG